MSSMNHGYWKSLGELEEGGALASADEHDLPSMHDDAAPPTDDGTVIDPLSRRNFARLMGASFALAGIAGAGCKRYDKEEIAPLSRRPDGMTPGVTEQYATLFDFVG